MQIFKNWSKTGEGVIGFLSQTNSILLFRPRITVQNVIKIESKLRRRSVYRQSDRLTE